MSGVRTPDRFVVQIPATSANLGPGFDCLALALAVYNTVEVELSTPSEARIVITGEGSATLPTGPGNVVLNSMRLLAESCGKSLPPMILRLHNNIPLGRGMGSSAAAIVGGLFAAALVLGEPSDCEALLPLALRVESHPDNVVAALYGGFTLGVHVDQCTMVRRFDPPAGLRAVLLIPDQFSSTKETRAALPLEVPRADALYNVARCALLVSDLVAGRIDGLAAGMNDRLHQPYRAQIFPYLPDALSAALAAGAHGAALSGAGSSVIALVSEHAERVSNALQDAATTHHVPAHTRVVDLEACGARTVH